MIRSALVLSYMMRMGEEKKWTAEEIKFELNQNVSECEIAMYTKIIEMLSSLSSYEEIINYIDNYTSPEYEELLEDEKGYVKTKVKTDLNIRINKLKRRDKNE